MSKKTAWTDHLRADSDLPADEFTWTEGSNYGLDGFSFDQTLGEGLNHGDQSGLSGPITPAQTKGMSALPDGLLASEVEDEDSVWGDINLNDEVDGLDLGGMLSEDEGALPMAASVRKAASIVDLSWLDPTQEQDPARLPKELRPDQPPLKSTLELEEAWGVNRRTDGLNLVPNRDKAIADYEQAIESGIPATPGVGKNANDVAWHIKKATRMSHYGETVGTIHNYLHANLDAATARKAFGVIVADHGLAGKVFVRASAFPGLKNGKWVTEIRRIARMARYVITDNPVIATKLGMEMVPEVPWNRALAHYKPLLVSAGYRLASMADPKKTLQLAFLMGPKAVAHVPTVKPVEVRPADTVTAVDAKAALRDAPRTARIVVTRDDSKVARKRVKDRLVKAVHAGLLPAKDAIRLGRSTASPERIQQIADQIIQAGQVKQSSYKGDGTQWVAFQKEARDSAWVTLQQAELTAAQMRKAQEHVSDLVSVGLMRPKEATFALKQATAADVLKVATTIIQASNSLRRDVIPATPQQQYAGVTYREAEVQDRNAKRDAAWVALQEAQLTASKMQRAQDRVLEMIRTGLLTKKEALVAQQQPTAEQVMRIAAALVQAAPQLRKPEMPRTKTRTFQGALYHEMQGSVAPKSVKTAELTHLATWLRRQMSEGQAGNDLTSLIRLRFASPLRKAGASMVKALRQEHEGLAGHLYVDAGAYASKTGTSGCEKAAATHRTNSIRYVKAMDRCASCALVNANGVCTKYGKELLTRLPKNAAAFQQRMIHQADAPDQEITASLFNPQEFDLTAPMDVDVDDAPFTEDIGDVMFDGLHL